MIDNRSQDNRDSDADTIRILEPHEAIRRRPAAFVGGTDSKALHGLVFEVLDNSIEEVMAGHGSRIEVTIHADESVSVADDGRGIPVALHPTYLGHTGEPISTLELVMTRLYSGSKFGPKAPTVATGAIGLGVKAVNALSAHLTVQVRRQGRVHQQTYRAGRPTSAVDVTGVCETGETGTRITFLPDRTIFDANSHLDFDVMARRFRELASLAQRTTIVLRDERDGRAMSFHAGS